jgi:hypothetical protein
MGAPFWLRLGVGGLSQVSLGRAASLAHRFFCRPKLTRGYTKDDLRKLAKADELLSHGCRQQTTVLGRRIISYHSLQNQFRAVLCFSSMGGAGIRGP